VPIFFWNSYREDSGPGAMLWLVFLTAPGNALFSGLLAAIIDNWKTRFVVLTSYNLVSFVFLVLSFGCAGTFIGKNRRFS